MFSRCVLFLLSICLCGLTVRADEPATTAPDPSTIKPSWETQRHAMTYLLSIPAPRGQIVDRNGVPLAQTRVVYNLAVVFPAPLDFTDQQIIDFAEKAATAAEKVTSRPIDFTEENVVQHYRNRGVIPFDIATDLPEKEVQAFQRHPVDGLTLRAIYQRFYPQNSLAGHVIGYTGRTTSEISSHALQNNDLLWPDTEGREGLEQSFDDQLRGQPGQLSMTFDAEGKLTAQRIVSHPQPGYNVITTLDTNIQELAEKILQKRCRRGGAIVVIDPRTGEVMALASWPVFNPNDFIPSITAEKFSKLNADPNIPLLPRAYRSSYPAGSTFKVFTGVAGFESRTITPDTYMECPSGLRIGNLVFHNWRRSDAGSLNFVEALTQSCDTWFYQLGIKVGATPMVTWANRLGLGQKTGIPLSSESEGRIPTEAYMEATYHRHFSSGDLANFSIGQGDIQITPLQMAQAMATIGSGGSFYQVHLVRQIQTLSGTVVYSYLPRVRDLLNLSPVTKQQLKEGMIGVVSSRNGTAGSASVPGVKVCGKTGTAQWGPKKKERTAAWFAGFAPADDPEYAFAALYEGAVGEKIHGGTAAAPMIGDLLRELFREQAKNAKKGEEAPANNSDDSD